MPILMSDLVNDILLETGQSVFGGNLSCLQLDLNKFWSFMHRALRIYDRYKPLSKYITVTANDFYYTFPVGEVPEWISRAYPTGYGVISAFTANLSNNNSGFPPQIIYRYEKPTLYISMGGDVEVRAHFIRSFTITYTDGSTDTRYSSSAININTEAKIVQDVQINNIDYTDIYFIDLVRALFLIAVGKQKRAVTLTDFIIANDSQEVVSEGQALYDQTLQNLQDTSSWSLAIGG